MKLVNAKTARMYMTKPANAMVIDHAKFEMLFYNVMCTVELQAKTGHSCATLLVTPRDVGEVEHRLYELGFKVQHQDDYMVVTW